MLPALLVGLLTAMLLLQLALTSDVALPDAAAVAMRGGRIPSPEIALVPIPAVIAARPIFAPRQAPGSATAGAALGGAIVAGAVRIGGRGYAVIQLPGGRTINLPVGGALADWRLAAVSDSGARFVRGSEHIEAPFGAQPQANPGAAKSEEQ